MPLCADDFGLSVPICEGILALLQANKLAMVSVMSESPLLDQYAPRLLACQTQPEIGLHFNLTESVSDKASTCSSFPLWRLIFHLPTPALQRVVSERLCEQLQCFEALFGRKPDFVDGHQHIQVFPAIRQALATLADYYQGARYPWVRQVAAPFQQAEDPLKTLVLRLLNSGFRRTCQQYGFRYNQEFDGVYSLKPMADYPSLLTTWLARATPETVIMCHPALWDKQAENRVLAQARCQEYLAISAE